jgi:hypothetical protein
MQGKHPLTGKPIRIMQTETQIYRDKKTLIWLRDQEASQRYNRWETIVTSQTDLAKWHTALGQSPTLYICESTDNEEVAELLNSKRLDGVHLMFFRKDPLISYGKEKLKAAGYQNIVCLEEIQTMYPHTFFKWSPGQTKTEDLVLAVAILFRLQRVVGFTTFEQHNIQPYLARTQHLNMYIGDPNEIPEPLWLIQQYFKPSSREREREINHCLKNNMANPFIDKIILLNEDTYKLPKSDKLKQVVIGKRLTYWILLEYIQKNVPEGTLVAFANSDIYLDETWKLIWSTEIKDKFISLLRYEEPTKVDEEPKLFGPRSDSQDTWLLHADSLKSRTLKKEDFDFEFGRAGCDNALNLSMLKARFLICNPCLTLRTIHCHHSAIRTYDPKDIIDKPMYLFLNPTGLHDMQPLHDIKDYAVPWTPAQPFSRKINGDRKELRTFTTMLGKAEVFNYDPDEENRWLPPLKEKEGVYKMTNATQTYNGLVYDAHKIFLGPYESLKAAWSVFELSQLTPSLDIKEAVAVRCDEEVASNPYRYMHSYLSKVMRLRDAGYNGEFWVPRDQATSYENFLKSFGWEDGTVPIMPRTKEIQAFSQNLYMMSPGPQEGSTKEDMDALRKRLRGWITDKMEPKKAVIFQDDEFYDIRDAYTIEAALEELGYTTTVVYPGRTSFDRLQLAMFGASVCVSQLTTKSISHYLYWLLPRDAIIIEGQTELEPMGQGAHEAGAAGLEYWYFSMPRGKKELLRDILFAKVKSIFDKALSCAEGTEIVQKPTLPLLIVPTAKDGFHGHPGDSFREMAELWAEKEYVTLERSSSANHCWLKGFGEILLYDRPTYKWLDEDMQFTMALVGNPEPLNTKPMRDWTFWPRRPRLLEIMVSKTYDERNKNCVFYGKIENTVQAEMRKGSEWQNACDDFYMADGTTPYKYSHAEYLEKLGQAKFGLCLAGYGKKCHREIECMALGTVPICSADVDMDNYAEKPIEGTHYIRVKTPMEAKIIAETTTKEEWKKMSDECVRWWRANASAEGSWNLTKRLVGLT